jgi:hypothetical protein
MTAQGKRLGGDWTRPLGPHGALPSGLGYTAQAAH